MSTRTAPVVVGPPCVKCGSTARTTGGRCHPCNLARAKAYRQANPAAHTARARAWEQANPDRARAQDAAARRAWNKANPKAAILANARTRFVKAGADIRRVTVKDLERLHNRQHGRCYVCDAKLDGLGVIEHLIPLSRGGRHAIGNIALACQPCNNSKRARTVLEHRLYLLRRGVVWVPQRLF